MSSFGLRLSLGGVLSVLEGSVPLEQHCVKVQIDLCRLLLRCGVMSGVHCNLQPQKVIVGQILAAPEADVQLVSSSLMLGFCVPTDCLCDAQMLN